MRFTALFTATTVAVSGVAASPVAQARGLLGFNLNSILGFDFTTASNYNSPYPPWDPKGSPGWYYGNSPGSYPDIPCLGGLICRILQFFPYAMHCPPPPVKNPPPPPPNDGYFPTFSNLTGATQAADYQTFGLVDTVAECKAMCNTVSGCVFVNSYHDVNGKGGSTQLTCSLFTKCHDASTADNRGGQSQPNGSIDFIIDSDGYCKNGNTVADPN